MYATSCSQQMRTTTLLMCCLLLAHATTIATATATTTTTTAAVFTDRKAPRECSSIDVRNECRSLEQIFGCTVIKGFLIVVLLPKVTNSYNNSREQCDYSRYQFTRLREITDYLLFFDVKGLTSIRDMFPSLTVIRGRRLFLNYALAISGMPDLEMVEFRSLVAIQRGHVYIGSCPKLCHLDKINWDRLTLTPGENHIFPDKRANCSTPPTFDCSRCASGYCWSEHVCQIFENAASADHAAQDHRHACDAQCLGGCFNSSTGANKACTVCRGLSDHGACVAQCSVHTYMLENYQRCYTLLECAYAMGAYTYESTCVEQCPYGFKPAADTTADAVIDESREIAYADTETLAQQLEASKCVRCGNNELCRNVCNPHVLSDAIIINALDDADQIRGCEILNGSLIIAIRSAISERDLAESLASLREIRGHLKISRSPQLTSLGFLQNLERISGDPLENDLYALIVYDNQRLQALWKPQQRLVLDRGSMYIHLNNKLCNRVLRDFHAKVAHDQSKDSLQTSDQEVLCDPAKLMLDIQVLSHRAMGFTWRKEQTAEEVEVLYRRILDGRRFSENDELDSNVCTRINWERRLIFPSELQDNGTHYSLTIDGLTPNTQYACLVKTFGGDQQRNARSLLQMMRTQPDIPAPPILKLAKRTENTLTLELAAQRERNDVVDFYRLDVFEHAENQQMLDQRNYCDQPALLLQEVGARNSDYDDCCERQQEEIDDQRFRESMSMKFSCSLDEPRNCAAANDDNDEEAEGKQKSRMQSVRLEGNATMYTLQQLTRFRLYTLQLRACNNAVGCGTYTLLHERTDHAAAADQLVDLRACRVSRSTEEKAGAEYRVYFSEPRHPNGAIVSYVVHYRKYVAGTDTFESHVKCVTRTQHATANYRYVTQLNASFNEIAVRVHSLAGDVMSPWIPLIACDAMSLPAGTDIDTEQDDSSVFARKRSKSVNYFLMFFLLGAGGTFLWVCYKRRYWRHIIDIWRSLRFPPQWLTLIRHEPLFDERDILVEEFETVRFNNNVSGEQNSTNVQ